MTPALTLTLSAQTMTAVSTVIGQQMRLVDVVIDQTFSAHRALMTPYFASEVKKRTSVAEKKAAAPKLKTKAAAKVKISAPKPNVVAEAKPVAVQAVVAAPVDAAPEAKAAPVQAAPAKTPVVAAKQAEPVAQVPAKPAVTAAVKAAPESQPTPATKPAPKIAVADPKPAVATKSVPRGKKVSVPNTPWDGKKTAKKKK